LHVLSLERGYLLIPRSSGLAPPSVRLINCLITDKPPFSLSLRLSVCLQGAGGGGCGGCRMACVVTATASLHPDARPLALTCTTNLDASQYHSSSAVSLSSRSLYCFHFIPVFFFCPQNISLILQYQVSTTVMDVIVVFCIVSCLHLCLRCCVSVSLPNFR